MSSQKEEKIRRKHEKKMEKLLRKTVLKEEKRKLKDVNSILKSREVFRKPEIARDIKDVKKPEIGKVTLSPDVKPADSKKTVLKEKEKPFVSSMNKKKIKASNKKIYFIGIVVLWAASVLLYFITKDFLKSFLLFFGVIILGGFSIVVKRKLNYYTRIKKMENAFPDFISLMASNLRAGMTIDRALLLSSRKEFAPLDQEILQVGKDILTAKEISVALNDMAVRINSEEITKTVQLIISGIRSGGNLSVLLEQTANNMRERIFVKKRASSNVLMYVIFIFFAVAVGAPLLFGLSTVLVEIMTNIFSGVDVETVNVNLPFTLSEISVSTTFVFYFSIIFIIMSAVMASLILGLVSSGKERDGLKYTVFLIISAIVVFLTSRSLLLRYFAKSFG